GIRAIARGDERIAFAGRTRAAPPSNLNGFFGVAHRIVSGAIYISGRNRELVTAFDDCPMLEIDAVRPRLSADRIREFRGRTHASQRAVLARAKTRCTGLLAVGGAVGNCYPKKKPRMARQSSLILPIPAFLSQSFAMASN